MTRKTNARIVGYAFILYIAAGILSMALSRRARGGGEGIAARLASMPDHTTAVGIAILLTFVMAFAALWLGVSLYALTRDEDPDLAMMGMISRVAEGVVGVSVPSTVILLWLATAKGSGAPDVAGAQAIGAFLLRLESSTALISATLFAVGSTLFCWLLLRGRIIPAPLAWIGLVGSALLVIGLPFQLAGFFTGIFTQLMWIPVAIFEITVAPWLIIKGAPAPMRRVPA
jgi:hypothetical protein